MYRLNDQQIDYILSDIGARGVEMESLQLNLLDHICCIVERDLEENVETSIKRSFNQPSGGTRILPSPINNHGIDVVFCGIAVTAGHVVGPLGRENRRASLRNSGRDDRLRQIWLSLFTRPEAVRFQPYCPQPHD